MTPRRFGPLAPLTLLVFLCATLCGCGGQGFDEETFAPGHAVSASAPPLAPEAHAPRPIDGLAEAYREGAAERERILALQTAPEAAATPPVEPRNEAP